MNDFIAWLYLNPLFVIVPTMAGFVIGFVPLLIDIDGTIEESHINIGKKAHITIVLLFWIVPWIVALSIFGFVCLNGFYSMHTNHQINNNRYLNRIAHQETVKPYRYYLDGNKLYYQLSKNGKQSTDKIDHKVVKLSDHKQGTAVYGKRWVANKGDTKAERQLVKQQEIVWYKATYKQGSISSRD